MESRTREGRAQPECPQLFLQHCKREAGVPDRKPRGETTRAEDSEAQTVAGVEEVLLNNVKTKCIILSINDHRVCLLTKGPNL